MARLRVISKKTPPNVNIKSSVILKQEKHQALSSRYKKALLISLLVNAALTTILGLLGIYIKVVL